MSAINRKKKIRDREKVGPMHIYAYKVLNERCKFLHPKFQPLEKAIKESMMPIPFEVYIASMVFFSIISTIGGAIVGIGVALMVDVQPVILEYLIPVGAAVGFGAMTFVMLQLVPTMRVKSRSSKLMEEIPHFIGYMSTLATSGLNLREFSRQLQEKSLMKRW